MGETIDIVAFGPRVVRVRRVKFQHSIAGVTVYCLSFAPLRHYLLAAPLAALLGCAGLPAGSGPEFSSFVVMGENGGAVARVLIGAPACPALTLDGRCRLKWCTTRSLASAPNRAPTATSRCARATRGCCKRTAR